MDEAALYDLVFAGKTLPAGEVVMVCDDSFSSGALLHCKGSDLRQQMQQWPRSLAAEDLIFLWPGAITVVHHGGGFAHIGW